MMRPVLAALLAATLLTSFAHSQGLSRLRVDVELVQTVVTVSDPQGRFVDNLTPADFIVELDGIPQDIAHFTQDANVAVSLGVLLDISASMRLKFEPARSAALRLVYGLRPNDQGFLMVFASDTQLKQRFTSDRARLANALRSLSRFGSGTDLRNALFKATTQARRGTHRKTALVVITDAGDTSSGSAADFRRARGQESLLTYALQIRGAEPALTGSPVGLPRSTFDELSTILRPASPATREEPPPQVKRRPLGNQAHATAVPSEEERFEILNAIATETGGRWFPVDADKSTRELEAQMSTAVVQILAELRAQYSLGFYCAPGNKLGTIRVRLAKPNNYIVRSGQ